MYDVTVTAASKVSLDRACHPLLGVLSATGTAGGYTRTRMNLFFRPAKLAGGHGRAQGQDQALVTSRHAACGATAIILDATGDAALPRSATDRWRGRRFAISKPDLGIRKQALDSRQVIMVASTIRPVGVAGLPGEQSGIRTSIPLRLRRTTHGSLLSDWGHDRGNARSAPWGRISLLQPQTWISPTPRLPLLTCHLATGATTCPQRPCFCEHRHAGQRRPAGRRLDTCAGRTGTTTIAIYKRPANCVMAVHIHLTIADLALAGNMGSHWLRGRASERRISTATPRSYRRTHERCAWQIDRWCRTTVDGAALATNVPTTHLLRSAGCLTARVSVATGLNPDGRAQCGNFCAWRSA